MRELYPKHVEEAALISRESNLAPIKIPQDNRFGGDAVRVGVLHSIFNDYRMVGRAAHLGHG
jgi:hypothetical protein